MANIEQSTESFFNEEFCVRLEYRICREFAMSSDNELKGFWCDGISWLPVEKQLTKKWVRDSRKITTKTWIGKDGQNEYPFWTKSIE